MPTMDPSAASTVASSALGPGDSGRIGIENKRLRERLQQKDLMISALEAQMEVTPTVTHNVFDGSKTPNSSFTNHDDFHMDSVSHAGGRKTTPSYSRARSEIQPTLRQLQRVQDERDTLKTLLTKLENDYEALRKKQVDVEEMKRQHQRRVEEITCKLELVEDDYHNLRNTFESQKDDYATLEKVRWDVSKLKETITQKEKECEDISSKYTKTKTRKKELEVENREMRVELERSRNSFSEIQKQCEEENNSLKHLEGHCQNLETELKEVSAQVREARAAETAAKDSIAPLQEHCQQLSRQTQIALEDKAKGIQDERELCNNKIKLYQEKSETILRKYETEMEQLRRELSDARAKSSSYTANDMKALIAERYKAVDEIDTVRLEYNKLVARLKTTEEQLVVALKKKAPRQEQSSVVSDVDKLTPRTDPSGHTSSLGNNSQISAQLKDLHDAVKHETGRCIKELELGIDLTKNLLGESRATQLLDKILEERKAVFRDVANKCQQNYEKQSQLLQRFVGGYITPHDLECATSALLRNEISSLKEQLAALSAKSAVEQEKYVELAYAIDQDKQAWREENVNYENVVQQLEVKNKQLEGLLAEAHRQEFMGNGRWNSHRS